jgi:putative PIN family toxin of toxin-antitoxin system
MSIPQIVIDTNVLIAALRSRRGASAKLISLLGTGQFENHLSVPLVLEYEETVRRHQDAIHLSSTDIVDLIDSLCALSIRHEIYYLWRPYLSDPGDDLVLELAISARCETIVTYNLSDFVGVDQFGVQAMTPRDFLHSIGEVKS